MCGAQSDWRGFRRRCKISNTLPNHKPHWPSTSIASSKLLPFVGRPSSRFVKEHAPGEQPCGWEARHQVTLFQRKQLPWPEVCPKGQAKRNCCSLQAKVQEDADQSTQQRSWKWRPHSAAGVAGPTFQSVFCCPIDTTPPFWHPGKQNFIAATNFSKSWSGKPWKNRTSIYSRRFDNILVGISSTLIS